MAWNPPVRRTDARGGGGAQDDAQAGALIKRIDQPTLAKACLLIEFWNAKQPEGIVVGRDVPSRGLASLLSSLVLYEPVDDGADWRIRLAGTALLHRFGRDVSGSLISALYPRDHFLIIRSRALGVLQSRLPHVDDVIIRSSERMLQHFETVHVPVYAPDGATQWDMAGYFYFH